LQSRILRIKEANAISRREKFALLSEKNFHLRNRKLWTLPTAVRESKTENLEG
jgi:hypothetical protein